MLSVSMFTSRRACIHTVLDLANALPRGGVVFPIASAKWPKSFHELAVSCALDLAEACLGCSAYSLSRYLMPGAQIPCFRTACLDIFSHIQRSLKSALISTLASERMNDDDYLLARASRCHIQQKGCKSRHSARAVSHFRIQVSSMKLYGIIKTHACHTRCQLDGRLQKFGVVSASMFNAIAFISQEVGSASVIAEHAQRAQLSISISAANLQMNLVMIGQSRSKWR